MLRGRRLEYFGVLADGRPRRTTSFIAARASFAKMLRADYGMLAAYSHIAIGISFRDRRFSPYDTGMHAGFAHMNSCYRPLRQSAVLAAIGGACQGQLSIQHELLHRRCLLITALGRSTYCRRFRHAVDRYPHH